MAKKIEITLFNNYDYDFEEYKELYQDCYDLTDEEMAEVADDDIYNYLWECLESEWEDLSLNLSYSKFDKPCVVLGSLGLWNGNKSIVPVVCDNVSSAIDKCVNGCDYIEVRQVCGHIEVSAIHHDGTNTFEIHLLNGKGISAMERIKYGDGKADLSCRCYHKAIKGYVY